MNEKLEQFDGRNAALKLLVSIVIHLHLKSSIISMKKKKIEKFHDNKPM